jgi:hypothetical protein
VVAPLQENEEPAANGGLFIVAHGNVKQKIAPHLLLGFDTKNVDAMAIHPGSVRHIVMSFIHLNADNVGIV